MELLQFRYFCDAAMTENFSFTAKKFDVPPSAVSQSIRRLEEEMGVKLFTRHKNAVFLNKSGEMFYKRISAALREIEGAVSDVKEFDGIKKIRICVNAHRATVKRALAKFQKLYPEIDISIKNFQNPTEEEFDFIIASDEVQLEHFKRYKIISENLAIAINNSNPLAKADNFSIEMLKNEPFIILQKPSSMHDLAYKICAKHGFVPHIAIQTDDPSYIPEFLRLGLGVCIVAKRSAEQWSYHESVLLKEIEGCTRDTYVYFMDKKMSPCEENMLNLLIEEFK